MQGKEVLKSTVLVSRIPPKVWGDVHGGNEFPHVVFVPTEPKDY